MKVRFFRYGLVLILIVLIAELSWAGLIDYSRRLRREKIKIGGMTDDANPDGQKNGSDAGSNEQEDGKEFVFPKWFTEAPAVTNTNEGRYDVNRDGTLQKTEVIVYLRDVLDVIEQKGGFTINSDILKEYDKNKDGFVSKTEAKVLTEQIR